MKFSKLSIIIPAYNEAGTIKNCVNRVLKTDLGTVKKEIIIVNDGSIDKTSKVIRSLKSKRIVFIDKKRNEGKGAAIRDALRKTTGQVIVIQDADLEYDPHEIRRLLEPIKNDRADVVFGSRFMGGEAHRVLLFWHMVGNKLLTLISNMVTNINLTDMETCYKMFTEDVAKKLKLSENRFGFEPEFTVKVARMGVRVFEMGISYSGRSYSEGKKINWRDGLWAIWCMIKYGILE